MEAYSRHYLAALKDAGTPVDESLLAELIAAENALGVRDDQKKFLLLGRWLRHLL